MELLAVVGGITVLSATVYLVDALYRRAALVVWWYSWPLDAWIERALNVPEHRRRFS